MKYIFTSMALLIAKSAGDRRTYVRLAKNKCTYNVSLFGADIGQETSWNNIFSRIWTKNLETFVSIKIFSATSLLIIFSC